MTTYPQAMVPVAAAGAAATPALMQSWVQVPFQFLTNMVVFRGQASTVQALSTGSQALAVPTTLEDPYTGWSETATGSQPAHSYLVPYTGLYEVTVTVTVASGAALWVAAGVQVSGGTPTYGPYLQAYSGLPAGASASFTVPAVAGIDYLQGVVYVSAAVNTDVASPGVYPAVEIAYVSGG